MVAPSKSYTAIADSYVDANSPLDVTLFTKLRDNDVNAHEWIGGSYTPALDHDHDGVNSAPVASVAAGAIAQAELKTTTGDLTETSTGLVQTGPGGEYGFWPTTKSSGVSTNGYLTAPLSPNNASGTATAVALTTSFANRIHTGEGGSLTLTVRQRYVQASPPYDLGDGDVPLFIFARVDAVGNILGTYVAPDPPWANNGPTNIRPDFQDRKTQKKFRRRLIAPRLKEALAAPAKHAALLAALEDPQFELVEIDQAMKQADMPLIPHPWVGNDLTGKTIVLLDPVSDIAHKLAILHESISSDVMADESVCDLLHGGHLRIDNTPLSRACPPGVMACAVAWK